MGGPRLRRRLAAAAVVLAVAGVPAVAVASRTDTAPTVVTPAATAHPSNLTLAGLHTTRQVVGTQLPVGGKAGLQKRMVARLIIPVQAGDLLDIEGRQRVTNDLGRQPGQTRYTVGVGYWLDSYNVDDGVAYASKTWTRLGSLNGDNVSPDRHHMPLHLHDVYEVPAGWPDGHRMVVVFRADAHSTKWAVNGGNDKVTVDDYGVLTVRRYRPA